VLTVGLGWRADRWALVPLSLLAALAIIAHVPRTVLHRSIDAGKPGPNPVVLAAAFLCRDDFRREDRVVVCRRAVPAANRGYALAASTVLVVVALLVGAVVPISGRPVDRRGERVSVAAGFMATGLAGLALSAGPRAAHVHSALLAACALCTGMGALRSQLLGPVSSARDVDRAKKIDG
jgi:predicted MFS family arabinose efflux permease